MRSASPGSNCQVLRFAEAPIGFTEGRREREGPAIGVYGLGLPPYRAQGVAIAMPEPRVLAIERKRGVKILDRLSFPAKLHVDRRPQRPKNGDAGTCDEHRLDRGERRLRLIEPMQHDRLVIARRQIPWRQLYRGRQKLARHSQVARVACRYRPAGEATPRRSGRYRSASAGCLPQRHRDRRTARPPPLRTPDRRHCRAAGRDWASAAATGWPSKSS